MKFKFLLIFIFISECSLHAQVPASIPNKGLQGYWSFSGNANDASVNKRHGKTHGLTLVKDRFGNQNGAYQFDGIHDFITTEYPGILGAHPRAVSFWANIRDSLTACALSWGRNELFPNLGGRFDCGFGHKRAGVTVGISDAMITYEAMEPVYDGKWHHYLFQFDKTCLREVEVYQDGLLLLHEPYHYYPFAKINTRKGVNVSIGAIFLDDTSYLFKGHLDDIAMYDRTLSRDEIDALYNAPDPVYKFNYSKWISIFCYILFPVAIIYWLIRLRIKAVIKKEKEKIQVEKKWYEQENRVLKAQMDPHFIFNSLNTIQQFIIVNDNEKAQLYLSTFAQLIRMQLESNTNESILLSQELEILEKYMEIESLRFNNAFDYEISVDPDIDRNAIYVPCFLVQPFVENALYHGLLPKLGYKELDIIFKKINEKVLLCIVEDNGIGRINANSKKSAYKKKSLGVNFVQQRLLIMSKMDNYHYSVDIIDKTDEAGNSNGTRIEIKMPILNN